MTCHTCSLYSLVTFQGVITACELKQNGYNPVWAITVTYPSGRETEEDIEYPGDHRRVEIVEKAQKLTQVSHSKRVATATVHPLKLTLAGTRATATVSGPFETAASDTEGPLLQLPGYPHAGLALVGFYLGRRADTAPMQGMAKLHFCAV